MYVISHAYDESGILYGEPQSFVAAVKELVNEFLIDDDYDECYLDFLTLYLFFERKIGKIVDLTEDIKNLIIQGKPISPKYFDQVDNYKQILLEKIKYIADDDDDTAFLLMRFIIDKGLFDDSLITMKVEYQLVTS